MSFDGGYDEQTNDCGPGDADFLPCPSGLPAGPEFRPRDAGSCFLFSFPVSILKHACPKNVYFMMKTSLIDRYEIILRRDKHFPVKGFKGFRGFRGEG